MSILNKIFRGNTLYYPGCLTKFVGKDIEKNYQELLRKAGVDFIVLSEIEKCCGSPVKNAGFEEDFKKLAEENLKAFKEHSVKRIITNCPACFLIFSKDYPKLLGQDWDIEVRHFTEFILEAAKTGKLELPKYENVKATYHDPCHLGKQSEIYEQPRELLKIMGINLVEMQLNKVNSFCCGGGGGLQSNNPELADKVARQRLEQARDVNVDIIITPCTLCDLHMGKSGDGLGVEVYEFSEVLMRKMN